MLTLEEITMRSSKMMMERVKIAAAAAVLVVANEVMKGPMGMM